MQENIRNIKEINKYKKIYGEGWARGARGGLEAMWARGARRGTRGRGPPDLRNYPQYLTPRNDFLFK